MQAKFYKATNKVAIYTVQGTDAELAAYAASITAQGREPQYQTEGIGGPLVKNSKGQHIPLFFTAFPMPNKDQWYNLVQIQSGPNKGNYTLDTQDLSFDRLLAKSFGKDLGDHIAGQLASKHTGVSLGSNAPVSSSVILTDDDDETDSSETESKASASADMDAIASKGK